MYIGSGPDQGVVSSTDNGVVLYYRQHNPAPPAGPAPHDPSPAAAGQLTEWTIRDQSFLTKVSSYNLKYNNIGPIADSELKNLINYDVSYVDDAQAPVAMEAPQVPIPIEYVISGTATTNFSNEQTTTTIQLNKLDEGLPFLLQLLTTQPGPGPKPSWQLKYNVPNSNQVIQLGTVTNVDTTNDIVTAVIDGPLTGALPADQAGFNFYTNDVTAPYGWTGAQNDLQAMKQVLQNFTSNDPNVSGLGQYFGGKGWPQYYNSDPSLLKIPGGANILVNSPLTDKRSPYDQFRYLLTSAGNIRIQYGATATLTNPNQDFNAGSKITLKVNTTAPNFTPQDLQDMKSSGVTWDIIGNDYNNVPIGSLAPGDIDTTNETITFTLTQTITDRPSGYGLTFQAPKVDPYSTKLRDLWYSWANYYVNLPKFQNLAPQTISATVSADTDSNADTRVLTFSSAQPQLALGMKVTDPGGTIKNLVTILKISDDKTKVYLSASVDPTLTSFIFSKPDPITTGGDQVNMNLIDPNGFGTDKPFADAFAASVYETMSVYSTIQDLTIPELTKSFNVVYESIGGGVGHLPTASFVNISADVRDLGKSVLRGVPDFVTYPNQFTTDGQWKPGAWYPPPSKPMDNASYNVFNLDPYVWFVHQRLGLSGYGFSFDDDAADIGAGGASTLSFSYGGLNGLPNHQEWAANTQWGPVTAKNATLSKYTVDNNPDLPKGSPIANFTQDWAGIIAYNQIRPDDPKNGVLGAYISGTGIVNGTGFNDKTRVKLLVDLDRLTIALTQPPNQSLPYNADLTFTGTPPSPPSPPPPITSPPPSASPPPSNNQGNQGGSLFTSTPSLFQEFVTLVEDELLMTLNQFVSLVELALGFVPDPALAASVAAYQNAINANPLAQTLLGQEMINFTHLAILNLLMRGLPMQFGPGSG
jgi:hypothetical protein